MSQLRDDLNAVADLLEGEGRWCRGAYAVDRYGATVSSNDPHRVFGRCLLSAVNDVADRQNYYGRGEMKAVLLDAIKPSGWDNLALWNDAPERTQAEVVALMRKAAEAAE